MILLLTHYSPAGSYQTGICKRGMQSMSEEGSESYQTSVKPFEIEEEFYTGEQPVCVFLYINRHQQDPLKEQGT